MDGIPLMSRAACRNHAVRTLGCVNQMVCARVVIYGKGDRAIARTAGIRDARGIRHPPRLGYLYGNHARNHTRAMQLSHTCCYGLDRCRVI